MSKLQVGGVTRQYYLDNYSNWYGSDTEYAEKSINEIKMNFSDPLTRSQHANIGSNMYYLGEYYACQGNLLCFRDAYQGWRQIKRGFFYSYWYYRIKFQLYDELVINNLQDVEEEDDEPVYKADINGLRKFIGTGIVLAPNETKFFLDEIENSVQTHTLNWEFDDCYVEYILHLYQKLNNRPLVSALPLKKRNWIPSLLSVLPFAKKKWRHPYDDIFRHWNNETKLRDAVLEMLDYHLKWNLGYTQDEDHHYSEFHSHFSMINPVEVHALEFVRNALNLKTPAVNHPFLKPPFYPIPAGIQEISMEEILNEDPLLKEIVLRFRESTIITGQKHEPSEPSSFSSRKKNENVSLLNGTLSAAESTPVKNENIRVYFLLVEQLQKLFGSKDLSLLESFDFSPYHSDQVYTATKYLLEGIDNSPDISSAEYALAWEILCCRVGKKTNIEEFRQVKIPARNAFESIMIPLEMAAGENEVLGYMMKQFMIEELLKTIGIKSMDSTDPDDQEQETALGLGILMYIANQIQDSDNRQTATVDNRLQQDPDFINTSLGIVSLILLAMKEKQDLMIFLSPATGNL
ncbi:MAG: hypothetical protein LBU34_02145 [Planctomycetaceae bacterium]|jgi:hypothetical protein|nr:hypothetical protein [Planctomycetaceae bacterium]